MLKPQDILVSIRLAISPSNWSYRSLSEELSISLGEISESLHRAEISNLIDLEKRRANRRNLTEFLIHGLKYCYPVRKGGVVRGIPTSFGAEPLRRHFRIADSELLPVWKDPNGSIRGYEINPFYQSIPEAAKKNPLLYELLVLVDAIREGRARERNLAVTMLEERIKGGAFE